MYRQFFISELKNNEFNNLFFFIYMIRGQCVSFFTEELYTFNCVILWRIW